MKILRDVIRIVIIDELKRIDLGISSNNCRKESHVDPPVAPQKLDYIIPPTCLKIFLVTKFLCQTTVQSRFELLRDELAQRISTISVRNKVRDYSGAVPDSFLRGSDRFRPFLSRLGSPSAVAAPTESAANRLLNLVFGRSLSDIWALTSGVSSMT